METFLPVLEVLFDLSVLSRSSECLTRCSFSVLEIFCGVAPSLADLPLPNDSVWSPDVDQFASPDCLHLPLFLTEFRWTEAGDLDTCMISWNRWQHIYLFPPPVTSFLHQMCQHLQSYCGRVHCPLMGGTAVLQLSDMVVPLPTSFQQEQFLGQGHLSVGNILCLHAWIFLQAFAPGP